MPLAALLLMALASPAPSPAPLPAPAGPVALPEWGLADALAAFRRSSAELQLARLQETAAAAETEQAALRPNPEASMALGNVPLRANTTPSGNGGGLARNWTGAVGLSQALELGGKRGRRIAAARQREAAARAGGDDVLRLASFDVGKAFWQAVVATSHRELAEEVRDRYRDTVRLFRARFAADDVSKGDLEKIELEALRQENDLADARTTERTSLQDLLRLVGPAAPPAVRLRADLAEPVPPAPDDAALLRTGGGRADVRAAERHLAAARAAVEQARAEAVPDLTVGATYTHSQGLPAGDNPDSLTFSLGIPIPFFHRNQGEIARAGAEVGAAQIRLAAAQALVAREVAQARARFDAAAEKVARYLDGTLARAERALVVAERAHREGAASLLVLLEAERTYIALRQDYLDTLFELRVARLELERASGASPAEPSENGT